MKKVYLKQFLIILLLTLNILLGTFLIVSKYQPSIKDTAMNYKISANNSVSLNSNLSENILQKKEKEVPIDTKNKAGTITLIVLISLFSIIFVLIIFWPKKDVTDSYVNVSNKDTKKAHKEHNRIKRNRKK